MTGSKSLKRIEEMRRQLKEGKSTLKVTVGGRDYGVPLYESTTPESDVDKLIASGKVDSIMPKSKKGGKLQQFKLSPTLDFNMELLKKSSQVRFSYYNRGSAHERVMLIQVGEVGTPDILIHTFECSPKSKGSERHILPDANYRIALAGSANDPKIDPTSLGQNIRGMPMSESFKTSVGDVEEVSGALSPSSKYRRQWFMRSNSGFDYKISETVMGDFECSCKGWTMHTPRKDCKHITAVKQKLASFAFDTLSPEPPEDLDKLLSEVATTNAFPVKHSDLPFTVDKRGNPFCLREHLVKTKDGSKIKTPVKIEMEFQWGSVRCPRCGFTVTEQQYLDALNSQKTPERPYPH